jgi:hypothetical protein
MTQPSNTTITIDGNKFNALAAHVSLATVHDDMGMPMMGSTRCAIECTADMHDNVTYSTLQALYDLANGVTREKIKTIKIEFWQDENQADASAPTPSRAGFPTSPPAAAVITSCRSASSPPSKAKTSSTSLWATRHPMAAQPPAILYDPPLIRFRIDGRVAPVHPALTPFGAHR